MPKKNSKIKSRDKKVMRWLNSFLIGSWYFSSIFTKEKHLDFPRNLSRLLSKEGLSIEKIHKSEAACELICKASNSPRIAAYCYFLTNKISMNLDLELQDYYKSPSILLLANKMRDIPEYDQAEELKYALATFYLSGKGVEKDVAIAVEFLNSVPRAYHKEASYLALRNIIIRSALGLNFDRNIELARNLYPETTKTRCDCDHYYDDIEYMLEHAEDEIYQDQALLLLNYIGRVPDIYGYLFSGDIIIDQNLVNAASVIKIVALGENWPDANLWQSLYRDLYTILKGYDPRVLKESSIAFGPFYNRLAENGLPVLGDYRATFLGSDHELSGQEISPGWVKFNGLTAKNDGRISLDFEESTIAPALIFPEDVDVALVTAFGYDEFLWPSVDVPHEKESGFIYIRKKDLEPEWLLNTDYGRTLYSVDVLGGALSWDMGHFKTVSGNDKVGELSKDIHDEVCDIANLNPKKSGGKLINVNLETAEIICDTEKEGALCRITPRHLKICFDGGYAEQDGATESWLFRNDTNFSIGATTRILTERFDDVAAVLPVYERYRQLAGLTQCLHSLRQAGFTPNEGFKQVIQRKRIEFESRQSKPHMKHASFYPFLKPHNILGCDQ